MKGKLIIVGGIIFIIMGLFHLAFYFLFDWKNQLNNLSQINSNILQMLNYGTALVLFSLGFILIRFRDDIKNSKLGKALLIFASLFYFTRLVMEFVFPGSSLFLGAILLIFSLIYLIPVFIKE